MPKYTVNINGQSFTFNGHEHINIHDIKNSNGNNPAIEELIEFGKVEAEVIENQAKTIFKNGAVIYQSAEKIINVDKASGFRIGD